MSKLFPSGKIYVGKSKIPDAGGGVFAKRAIKKGEFIESCPFIEVPHDSLVLNETSLVEYLFFFGKDKERVALSLGFGSLYNHSDEPNAVYKIKSKEKLIKFTAIKAIKKDEEITFDYRGGDRSEKAPLWFEE